MDALFYDSQIHRRNCSTIRTYTLLGLGKCQRNFIAHSRATTDLSFRFFFFLISAKCSNEESPVVEKNVGFVVDSRIGIGRLDVCVGFGVACRYESRLLTTCPIGRSLFESSRCVVSFG